MSIRKTQRQINYLKRKLENEVLFQWKVNEINEEISRLEKKMGRNLYNGFATKFQPAVLVEVDNMDTYLPMDKTFQLNMFNYRKENG